MNQTTELLMSTEGIPGNAYTMKKEIDQRGWVQIQFESGVTQMVEVKTCTIVDTNELHIAGVITSQTNPGQNNA